MTTVSVVLGSASPARLRVLRAAGLDPRVIVSDVDEDAVLRTLHGAPPAEVVVRLAGAKADAVVATILAGAHHTTDTVVLTCDSMLLFDGALSGKPHTVDAACAQWRRMRGRSAELLTGHWVSRIRDSRIVGTAQASAATTIHFADIDDATVDAYAATGEPLAVAGAFTLDGLGGWFVEAIDGDPSSVIGIGLPTVRGLLADVGVDVTSLWR
ncbi:Maf family protein [Gordonia sp. DT101]|uniref:Maf family protein n=1 Tax=Gordonia sp. DT101 TaxID=3416545 RepID=UPI003CF9FA9A